MAATAGESKLEAGEEVAGEDGLGSRDAALAHHGGRVVVAESEGAPDQARHARPLNGEGS